MSLKQVRMMRWQALTQHVDVSLALTWGVFPNREILQPVRLHELSAVVNSANIDLTFY